MSEPTPAQTTQTDTPVEKPAESVFDQLTLTPPISSALHKLKINQATAVQEAVIPEVLAGKDLLVSAHTGSGKTVAFALPLVHELQHRPAPDINTRALILAPTRELARQIQHVCEVLGQAVNVTSVTLTGGVAFQEQNAALRKAPDIVIATPGRLIEHLNRGTLDLSDLTTVVLDEADRMLDMGFQADVMTILSRCPEARQTLLFSATLDHRGVLALGKTLQKDAATIALNEARSVPENIQQSYLLAHDVEFKEKLVRALVAQHGDQQIIIFTNTIVRTQQLHAKLNDPALRCALLHGDLTQEGRNTVVSGMRDGRFRILVTTDVAARGLDLPNVGLVVNFDLARKGDEYLHRVGRTGRAGQAGLAISLIMPHEWNMMIRIQNYMGKALKRQELPGLKSAYQGPDKMRKSGKAFGTKKKKTKDGKVGAKKGKAGSKPEKTKVRARDVEKKGKRRTGGDQDATRDGSAPLRRRPASGSGSGTESE